MEEGPELDQFVNQSLSVIPIQVDRRRRKFICSHKQSRQSSRSEVNMKLFDELEVGSVGKGSDDIKTLAYLWMLVVLKGWFIFLKCLGLV